MIGAVKMILQAVKPPRTLLVRSSLGKLVGKPHDIVEQTQRVSDALSLLETVTIGGTIVAE